MPNWCANTLIFRGNKEEISLLEKKLAEWTAKELYETAFGNNWLGNLLLGAGICTKEEYDLNIFKYRCRGFIDYVSADDEKTLCVQCETAWSPMFKMWRAILKELGLHSVDFTFISTEPGMQNFLSNDKEFLKTPYELQIYLQKEDQYLFPILLNEDEYEKGESYISMFDLTKKDMDEFLQKAKREFVWVKKLEDLNRILKGNHSFIEVRQYSNAQENWFE